MPFSKSTISVLVDLVENRLATVHVGSREGLREALTLQHCLSELRGAEVVDAGDMDDLVDTPRRGRRPKMTA